MITTRNLLETNMIIALILTLAVAVTDYQATLSTDSGNMEYICNTSSDCA